MQTIKRPFHNNNISKGLAVILIQYLVLFFTSQRGLLMNFLRLYKRYQKLQILFKSYFSKYQINLKKYVIEIKTNQKSSIQIIQTEMPFDCYRYTSHSLINWYVKLRLVICCV